MHALLARVDLRSTQTHRLQVIVSADDLLQEIFARPIAAIGIGVVAFDEFLVARFDLGAGRGLVEGEYLK
jgi:hypothetical protein